MKEPGASGGVFKKEGLGPRIKHLFRGAVVEETWASLEDLLLKADLGPKASSDLVARVKADYTHGANPENLVHRRSWPCSAPTSPCT